MSLKPLLVSLKPGKKIYFASDFHFGIPDYESSRKREARVCNWLDGIATDAQQIYLLGDLFDSWMEYKRVVPKGYVRFLGKLAGLSDAGIDVIVFTGNHDMWMHGYFEQELNAKVYKDLQTLEINGKAFYIGHGDGVSEQEKGYRRMKALFRHPLSQWIYRQLHPDVGLRMADFFSRLGPKHHEAGLELTDIEKEYQILHAHDVLKTQHYDYFIFGHRHSACELKLNAKATFINLGDWFLQDIFAVFDGEETRLLKY